MARRIARPFVPSIRAGKSEAEEAARELTNRIEQWEAEGLRFSHLESVTTVRKNGCLASLTGNPTSVVTFQNCNPGPGSAEGVRHSATYHGQPRATPIG